MALEQKLSLKLSQKLVMSSLQQVIKLLQMTRMEVETPQPELVENPILKRWRKPAKKR
jgi:DNA-directed RNA polymerase specialized sigma54-like protein